MVANNNRKEIEFVIRQYFRRENIPLVAEYNTIDFKLDGNIKLRVYKKFLEYALNSVFLKIDLRNAFRRCWNNFEEYLEYNKKVKKIEKLSEEPF